VTENDVSKMIAVMDLNDDSAIQYSEFQDLFSKDFDVEEQSGAGSSNAGSSPRVETSAQPQPAKPTTTAVAATALPLLGRLPSAGSHTSLLGAPTPTQSNSRAREAKARKQREEDEAREADDEARSRRVSEATHLPYQTPAAWKAIAKEVDSVVSITEATASIFTGTLTSEVCYLAYMASTSEGGQREVVKACSWLLDVALDDEVMAEGGGDINGAALWMLEKEGGEIAEMAQLSKLSIGKLRQRCKRQGYQVDSVDDKMELVWLLTAGNVDLDERQGHLRQERAEEQAAVELEASEGDLWSFFS